MLTVIAGLPIWRPPIAHNLELAMIWLVVVISVDSRRTCI